MNRTVLVVEDDASSREALRILLESEGYAVAVAKDGEEALTAMRAGGAPGLILLDLRMRGMAGPEFRERQLRDPRISRIPVVVLSGQGNVAAVSHKLGAQAYVTKPIDVDRLLAIVEGIFAHKAHA